MQVRRRIDRAAQAGLDAAVASVASPATAAAAKPFTRRVARWWPWLLVPTLVMVLLVWLPLMLIVVGVGQQAQAIDSGPAITDGTCDGDVRQVQGLDEDQSRNAAIIVDLAGQAGVGTEGAVVALAAAFQECDLHNCDYGDRDSLGVFQQRPSTGWGTPEQILDPALATAAFYGVADHTDNPGLVDVDGWQEMSVAQAAQAVQRSAFPDAYARHETKARILVGLITGMDMDPCPDVAPPPAGDGEIVNPVVGDYTVTSGFGMRWGRLHAGIDLAAPLNPARPIVAITTGVVAHAGPMGGYGNVVFVDHADGIQTRYAHLSTVDVAPGDRMSTGGKLGAMGNTGDSTGPHLHFEVRVDGQPVDPAPWMAQRGVTL